MSTRGDARSHLLTFAKEMRKSPTDAEAKLWSILRARSLEGFKFRRQYPAAGYVLDFYCVRKRLAVELDGGQHNDEEQVNYDVVRSERLARIGIRMIRFWDDDVLKNPQVVMEEILRCLEESS